MAACGLGQADLVERLLQEDSSPLEVKDDGGLSPLLIATRGNHLDVVKALIRHKADLTYHTQALRIALRHRHQDMHTLLVQAAGLESHNGFCPNPNPNPNPNWQV